MFGLTITVPPSVFHPRFFRTTRFLGEYLRRADLRGKSFLEMGSGSGILSLIAARGGAAVTALDINPEAVAATISNARNNGLGDRLTAAVSDLFSGIPEDAAFDVILWNPPFYPAEPTDNASQAWMAGKGYSVLARFADSAPGRLRPGGKLLLQVSTEIDAEAVLSLFSARGMIPHCVASKKLPFETLSIYEFPSDADGD
jgi:release factor glutamine methyltransferase